MTVPQDVNCGSASSILHRVDRLLAGTFAPLGLRATSSGIAKKPVLGGLWSAHSPAASVSCLKAELTPKNRIKSAINQP